MNFVKDWLSSIQPMTCSGCGPNSVLEEGAAKARLAGVKAGEERLRSG